MKQIICAHCKTEFPPPNARSVYCTPECSALGKTEAFRVLRESLRARIDTLPTSRAAAKAAGEPAYYTGRKCPRGHIGIRNTASKGCLDCISIRRKAQAKYRQATRVREKARMVKEKQARPTPQLRIGSVWLHILPDWRPVVAPA